MPRDWKGSLLSFENELRGRTAGRNLGQYSSALDSIGKIDPQAKDAWRFINMSHNEQAEVF